MIAALVMSMSLTANPSVSEPAPLRPVPSARQLAWHSLEYYAFVHFNMNTFVGLEWGEGREDPGLFDPSDLDCRQWARVFRDAGMKGVILTAKHHDGFCLWPSEYTTHTVAASPFRGGRGDVLRELAVACAEFGLEFGVYLSPWDRNHPDYGDSAKYNAFFMKQLEEVLTSYGAVFEVWFDGACGEGPNGRRQEYDWDAFVGVVRKHQPNAVIFSDAGPDVRWVGNEQGFANATNWSFLRRDEFEPGTPRHGELASGHADGTHWVPAECDVSIRPGWYYHAAQDDAVKSVGELEEIYYRSVGRNAALLLNVPVDRRGLVHENDVAALMGLRQLLDRTFENDLALGARTTATNVRGDDARFDASRAVDGRPETYWTTDDEVTAASLTIDFGVPTVFNRVLMAEHIALGQRVDAFTIDASQGGEPGDWVRVAKGSTIGAKRIVRFPGVETTRLRLNIESARACPTIARLEVYAAPPRVTIEAPAEAFMDEMMVSLSSDLPGSTIHYTLDGSEPTRESTAYGGPVTLRASAEVRARAWRGDTEGIGPAAAAFRAYRHEDLRYPTLFIRAPDPGLSFRYYEGAWQSLANLANAISTDVGVAPVIDLAPRQRDEQFALLFRGFVEVPADGIYTFSLTSDDGSRLLIGNDVIIDHDGLHGRTTRRGIVGLRAGHHPIRVEYFNASGDMALELELAGPGLERAPIPARMLFH